MNASGNANWVDCGGQGPPLLFAHANGYPPGSYRRLIERLTTEFSVKAIRFRPLWEPFGNRADIQGWRRLADDLALTIDAAFGEPVFCAGHSMGAVAALQAAIRCPEKFLSLALVDPVLLPRIYLNGMRLIPKPLRKRLKIVRRALRRPDHWPSRDAAYAFHRSKRVFAEISDEVLWDYISAATKPANGGFELSYPKRWEAEAYMSVPDIWRELPRCRKRMLGIRGTASHTLLPDAWALWQRKCPTAEFAELPGSHLVPLEHPDLVADAMLDFLRTTT